CCGGCLCGAHQPRLAEGAGRYAEDRARASRRRARQARGRSERNQAGAVAACLARSDAAPHGTPRLRSVQVRADRTLAPAMAAVARGTAWRVLSRVTVDPTAQRLR